MKHYSSKELIDIFYNENLLNTNKEINEDATINQRDGISLVFLWEKFDILHLIKCQLCYNKVVKVIECLIANKEVSNNLLVDFEYFIKKEKSRQGKFKESVKRDYLYFLSNFNGNNNNEDLGLNKLVEMHKECKIKDICFIADSDSSDRIFITGIILENGEFIPFRYSGVIMSSLVANEEYIQVLSEIREERLKDKEFLAEVNSDLYNNPNNPF